jgi:hypothetical protein
MGKSSTRMAFGDSQMLHQPTAWALTLILIALLCMGSGCFASAPGPDVLHPERGADESPPSGRRLVVTSSKLDIENRYPSTVMIKTPLHEGGNRTCSGVLIHSRLVLTAAHCVCGLRASTPRGDLAQEVGGVVIDGSTCASSVTVTTVVYRPPRMTDSDHRGHDGKVRPHRDFKILLDQQGNVLKNEADLAVILLDEPLQDEAFPPVPLVDDEVRISDRVLLVGYGYDRRNNGYSGDRRSGRSAVAALAADGKTFLVGQNGSHILSGDSGGPCFRGGMLVGVATTSSEPPVELSEFTSTYFYREWLREEVQSIRSSTRRPAAP